MTRGRRGVERLGEVTRPWGAQRTSLRRQLGVLSIRLAAQQRALVRLEAGLRFMRGHSVTSTSQLGVNIPGHPGRGPR